MSLHRLSWVGRKTWLTISFAVFAMLSATSTASVAEPSMRQAAAFAANEALGAGINLGVALEYPFEHESACAVGGTKNDAQTPLSFARPFVDRLKASGFYSALSRNSLFQSIRLPLAWHRHLCDDGRIDPAYLALAQEQVEAALEAGFVVIIDVHKFDDAFIDPDRYRGRFFDVWSQIALAFKDESLSLYFELLNEPQSRLGCATHWPAWIDSAVEAIRKTGGLNQRRPILLGGCNPGDWKGVQALSDVLDGLLSKDDMNPLIVTFHYYDPFSATHWRQEPHTDKMYCPDIMTSKERPQPLPLDCSSKCRDDDTGPERLGPDCFRKNNVERLCEAARFARDKQVPLHLGELGYEAVGDHMTWVTHESRQVLAADRVRWFEHVVGLARKLGMSWTYWNYFASFGFAEQKDHDALWLSLERESKAERPQGVIAKAQFESICARAKER